MFRKAPGRRLVRLLVLLALFASAIAHHVVAATAVPEDGLTHYRYATIDGVKVFYREAGPATAPVVLLLHGFPSSSHMFRNLIPVLSDKYHVIAPDYPGFGQSDSPDRASFKYTFEHFADIVDALLQQRGVSRYAMYVMDYGAPVGYRLALKHPDRVAALIIQNGNAYDEGLGDAWSAVKAYWADPSEAKRDAISGLVKPDTTISLYTTGAKDVSRVSPDNWVHDQALLDRPGNRDIQLDLLYDHRTNIPLYPKFQQFFRDRKPPALLVWGKDDRVFTVAGAQAYRRDLPAIEFHLIDAGHFALEDRLDEIGPLIHDFLDRTVSP